MKKLFISESVKTSWEGVKKIDEYIEHLSEIEGSFEPFNNCREQGFVVHLNRKDYSKHLYIWIYEQRNTDAPTITYSLNHIDTNGMFYEEDWRNNTYSFGAVKMIIEERINN